ncbi:hypothetical protein K439DRAFT_281724 [Ramaria rubella]|nr:hypothetical protein K439DRAFT_281724 [Ramaria rubella]
MQTAPRLRVLVENLWISLFVGLCSGENSEGLDIDSESESSWESAVSSSSDDTSDDSDLDLEVEIDPSNGLEYLNNETRTTLPSASQVVRAYRFADSAVDLSRTTKPSMSLCSMAFLPAVTDESYAHAQSLVILNLLCTSLRKLSFITSADTFISCMAASTFPVLSELTLYDLPSDSCRHFPGVKRLTILSNESITPLGHAQLSKIFPNLTHLRLPICLNRDVLLSLASLKNLTHLWLWRRTTPLFESNLQIIESLA